jgi:hypothetical protein
LSPSACLVDGLARQRDRQDRGSGTWPRRPLGADFREGGLGRLAVSGGGPESSNRRARGPASGRSPPPSLPRAWRRSGAGRGIRNRWPGCWTGPGSGSQAWEASGSLPAGRRCGAGRPGPRCGDLTGPAACPSRLRYEPTGRKRRAIADRHTRPSLGRAVIRPVSAGTGVCERARRASSSAQYLK